MEGLSIFHIQHMHAPHQGHLNDVYRILRYLKQTPGKGLFFTKTMTRKWKDSLMQIGPVQSKIENWHLDIVHYWGEKLVTWRSKKQSVVDRSNAEAEHRVMSHGICELIWIKRVMEELRIGFESPMELYFDNNSAISIAHNPVMIKHVEVDRHFIKEKLDGGTIDMLFPLLIN